MLFGIPKHVYYFLKENEPIYYNRLLMSKHSTSAPACNVVYRLCTERALLKSLRQWDQYAWASNLGWKTRVYWVTMYSVVKKLTNMDDNCIKVLYKIFMLGDLVQKFYKIKATKVWKTIFACILWKKHLPRRPN